MEVLINHLLKMGARRMRLEAKVFGGGAVLESLSVSKVGIRNAEFVLDYLKTERIPIVARDLLDAYPRKIYYFPNSGRVLVKELHAYITTRWSFARANTASASSPARWKAISSCSHEANH